MCMYNIISENIAIVCDTKEEAEELVLCSQSFVSNTIRGFLRRINTAISGPFYYDFMTDDQLNIIRLCNESAEDYKNYGCNVIAYKEVKHFFSYFSIKKSDKPLGFLYDKEVDFKWKDLLFGVGRLMKSKKY